MSIDNLLQLQWSKIVIGGHHNISLMLKRKYRGGGNDNEEDHCINASAWFPPRKSSTAKHHSSCQTCSIGKKSETYWKKQTVWSPESCCSHGLKIKLFSVNTISLILSETKFTSQLQIWIYGQNVDGYIYILIGMAKMWNQLLCVKFTYTTNSMILDNVIGFHYMYDLFL